MLKTREGFTASRSEHFSYSLFFFGQNILWAFAGLIGTYLADIGFTAAAVAAILIVPKIWDAVNDTLFGFIVDRVKPFHGQKFLPWIRIGVAAIGVFTLAMFAIPASSSQTIKIVWFLIAYILFDAAYTMLDAPMFALPTVMTTNIQERTSIIAGGKLWSMVGAMLATVLIPQIRPRVGWLCCGVILIAFSVICMLPILFKGKERHSEMQKKEEQISFKRMINYVGKNKYLLFVLLAMLVIGITNIEQILGIILARTCFGNEKFATIISLCVAVPVILVSAVIPTLAKKWDKFSVLIFGLGFSVVVGVVSYFVGYSNIILAVVFIALKCVGLAFYTVICYMLVADTVEYGAYKSGTRAAGITFSLQTFVSKLKNALVNSIAFGALAIFGYVSGEGATQPAGVAQGVWTVFNLLPAIGYAIAMILLIFFYKLRDKDVQTMSRYNNGEITVEQAEELLENKYGPAAHVEAVADTTENI